MSEVVKNEEKPDLQKKSWSVKRVSIIAVFIALSAVGAMIKIPSPIGTIGLDSCPGYFCALAFGGVEGMIVIAIGHILSAAVVGFPLTIPIHIAIAATMALWALIFRFIGKRGTVGIVIATVVAALLNAFGSGLLLIPIGGVALYVANMIPLLVAAAANAILAAIAFSAVKGSKLLA
jgi:uncharacterized membrane protein